MTTPAVNEDGAITNTNTVCPGLRRVGFERGES
jgi:hypothetical protein